jgi:hypothetical protein
MSIIQKLFFLLIFTNICIVKCEKVSVNLAQEDNSVFILNKNNFDYFIKNNQLVVGKK